MFCSPIHLLIMSKQVMISKNKLFTHIHVLLINFLIIHLLVSHPHICMPFSLNFHRYVDTDGIVNHHRLNFRFHKFF
jgi:c-di-AMP phosphodiesterase-like protein